MKHYLILSLSCFLSSSVVAQKQTEYHLGQKRLDVAYAVAATADGGYIVTGLSQSLTDTAGDIVVVKASAQGEPTWSFTYGGPELEGGNSIIQTADGGYMVGGHTEDWGARDCDAFLMKLDKYGAKQWLKVYGGDSDDICQSVVELPEGGFIIAGITASYGNTGNNAQRHTWFVKTNSNGDTIWTRCYAGRAAEYANSIAIMSQGGYLAAGWSTSFGIGESDGWLLRLKENGDTLWTRRYKTDGDTKFGKILPTLDNGYILSGYTGPAIGSPEMRLVGLAVKLDAEGNELWRKTYGGKDDGIAFHDVIQLPTGNFMFTGRSYARDTAGSAHTLTTDANGEKITDAYYGGSGSYATSIAVQGNNSFMIAGATARYDTYGDLYYMEMDNTISGISAINKNPARLYPNPVIGQSVIVLPASEANQKVRLDVTNKAGQHMMIQDNLMAKDLVISREDYVPGIYSFRITCKDGTMYTGSFTID